jgi:hypothetical protein
MATERHSEALHPSLLQGLFVQLHPLRIDHGAPLDDVVHVEGNRLRREGKNEVHRAAVGIGRPLRQADLVEVVPAANTRPIVLHSKDLEPAASEGLTQARSARFDSLASIAADQDAHVIHP